MQVIQKDKIKITDLEDYFTSQYTFKAFLYANNKYILHFEYQNSRGAIDVTQEIFLSSEDLKTWNETNLSLDSKDSNSNNYDYNISKLIYGNGIYILGCKRFIKKTNEYLGNYYVEFFTSKDLKTWERKITNYNLGAILPSDVNIKFVNDYFIFCLSNYNNNNITYNFYLSKDGKTWSNYKYTTTTNVFIHDISYINNVYVIACTQGYIFTTQNFKNFTEKIPFDDLTGKYSKLIAGNGIIIAINENSWLDYAMIYTSDGRNWIRINNTIFNNMELSFIKYYFIKHQNNFSYSQYSDQISISSDAINWETKNYYSGASLVYNPDNDNIVGILEDNDTYYFNVFTIEEEKVTSEEEKVVFNPSVDINDTALFVFNTSLEFQGIIDDFISLRWRRKYFEAGEFEIVIPITDNVMKFLTTDLLIARTNSIEVGIIETIEFNDNGTDEEITISGRFLSSILERRIIKNRINFNGTSIDGMKTLLNNMTPFSNNFEIGDTSLTGSNIVFQATYKNIYTYMCKLSSYSNIGFRISPDFTNKKYIYEFYDGLDRTINQNINERYAFGDENYNIEQATLTISNKTIVNYVLTGGTGEDTDRILVTTDKGATGFNLHEYFNDQKSLSNSDMTTDEYKNILIDSGNNKINEDGTFTFEVTATSLSDYKSKWDLGDIVNVGKEKWGINSSYRISEIEEVIEDGKKTVYPTFGSPLATPWTDDDN